MIATLVLIGTTTPLNFLGNKSEALAPLFNPIESLSDNASKDEIIMAIRYVANKYSVDEDVLMQTIKCESGFQHAGVFGDSMLAYGLAQFHQPTFKQYCEGSYYSAKDQLDCMGRMFSEGQAKHWSCYLKQHQTQKLGV